MNAVLNSALPIFALILTGFICGYFGVFDKMATDNLNRFAVYLALPSLMFVAMSKITPEQVRQFGFVGAFCGGFSITFAVAFAISRARGRRVANASIEGLDAGYSNVGFMGIPMCLLVFGPESAPVSIIATLFTACVLFLFAVVVVEIDLQKGSELLVDRRQGCFVASPQSSVDCASRGPLHRLERPESAGTVRELHHATRWSGFPGRACLHRSVSCAGTRGQSRRGINRYTSRVETDPTARHHGATRLLRLYNAAAMVAFGRDLERASDRIGTIHDREALRARGWRDVGLDSRFACICRLDCLTARRVALLNPANPANLVSPALCRFV